MDGLGSEFGAQLAHSAQITQNNQLEEMRIVANKLDSHLIPEVGGPVFRVVCENLTVKCIKYDTSRDINRSSRPPNELSRFRCGPTRRLSRAHGPHFRRVEEVVTHVVSSKPRGRDSRTGDGSSIVRPSGPHFAESENL